MEYKGVYRGRKWKVLDWPGPVVPKVWAAVKVLQVYLHLGLLTPEGHIGLAKVNELDRIDTWLQARMKILYQTKKST